MVTVSDLKSEPASSQTRSERALYRNLYRFDPQKTPDLALVVEACPKLPEAIKAGILAMVKVSTPRTDTFR